MRADLAFEIIVYVLLERNVLEIAQCWIGFPLANATAGWNRLGLRILAREHIAE